MYLEDYNIALMGRKGSGKSTVAKNFLWRDCSMERVSFAKPIKDMIRQFLLSYGLEEDMIERMIDGDLKEERISGLGVTPRHLMQTLGTEWGRDCIEPSVWGAIMSGKVKQLHKKAKKFVCDDARFENEVNNLQCYNTLLFRVISDKEQVGDGHASEVLPSNKPDIIFLNEFGIDVDFSRLDLRATLTEMKDKHTIVIYNGLCYMIPDSLIKYNPETTTFKQVKDLLGDKVE